MEPQQLAETRAAVEELVEMRNELVPHFIQRFDLWTHDGCTAAIAHLEDCYAGIDRHHRQLLDCAQNMDLVRTFVASQMSSSDFLDRLTSGIGYDGHFEWPATGIVRCLREAAARLCEDGWANLDEARAFIEANHPEQIPANYGCRTWPQVLAESRLFHLAYRLDEQGRKVAWFRERATH